jgi:presenilin 1
MFIVWNFAVGGLVAVFGKGISLRLQQIYLTVMSSMMAYSLTQLPAITSWILLALLAIWDLVAVLCPYGPLRILIENSQRNQREIPALLYSGIYTHSTLYYIYCFFEMELILLVDTI